MRCNLSPYIRSRMLVDHKGHAVQYFSLDAGMPLIVPVGGRINFSLESALLPRALSEHNLQYARSNQETPGDLPEPGIFQGTVPDRIRNMSKAATIQGLIYSKVREVSQDYRSQSSGDVRDRYLP
ncbi:hypothetical protein J6590_093564 [Homalodisca vitripennis]|nr:hypothetical protein J6590_093564 [Homalodisca vitripennis]